MRKELSLHFLPLFAFFLSLTILRRFSLDINLFNFWLGGFLGTILPDIDHFIYVFLLRPQELTSQRVSNLVGKQRPGQIIDLLYRTRAERTDLIFHTAMFQIFFLIFSFFIISSSGSFFGRGLVLAFSLHLLLDQYLDLKEKGEINSWFKNLPITPEKEKVSLYWIAISLLVLSLGLIF
jgi:hypothetical protein